MAENKLEFKINTDVDGSRIDLDNMSVNAAKSLIVILESLTKIIDETLNDRDVKIQIIKGSAKVIAEASDEYIELLETDFNNVIEHNCVNPEIVSNWRKIQSLLIENGLGYEVNFHKKGVATPVYKKITESKQFRTKPVRVDSKVNIAFLKGKLIANGGKTPNMHITGNEDEKYVINCNEVQAKNISPFLYSNVFISALCKTTSEENKYLFCDLYTNEEIFNEYKNYIEKNNNLNTEEELISIHYKMKEFIGKEDDFGSLRKLMRLYNYEFYDISILKTVLVITKGFKNNPRISMLRNDIKRIVEKKIGKTLI
jgi:hypothetical protein